MYCCVAPVRQARPVPDQVRARRVTRHDLLAAARPVARRRVPITKQRAKRATVKQQRAHLPELRLTHANQDLGNSFLPIHLAERPVFPNPNIFLILTKRNKVLTC